jgi:hypothetical protein
MGIWALALGCASTHYEMQNQGDYSKDQQQVDESTRNVKHAEAGNPSNQQNDEQNCPNAHFLSPLPNSFRGLTTPA